MRTSWLRLFWAGVLILGALVGYLATSEVGERLLHHEIETQLSRLLAGPVEIAQVEVHFDDGLLIEAHGLEAYPNPEGGPPSLRAGRVLAWIDVLSVLVGRLELSTLVLEGPQIRIEQRADGSFVGLPLPTMPSPAKEQVDDRSFAEQIATRLESLEPAAKTFLDQFRTADRVDVLDGSVTWIDHGRVGEDGLPREIHLELVSGTAARNWLSAAATLTWSGVFVDGQHAPFPFEFRFERDQNEQFEWTASFSQIPLRAAQIPFSFVESRDGLAGTLDASFSLTTLEPGTHRLTFEGLVRNAELHLRLSGRTIEQSSIELFAQAEFDENQVRLSEGRITGERLGLQLKASIDRPIGPHSIARLESRMVGARIAGIQQFTRQFAADFDIALVVSRLIENVRVGHVRYLETAGTASVESWLDLFGGRTRELPDDFLLGGGIDQLVLDIGGGETIEELAGEIDWIEDRVSLRNMVGTYRGKALPVLNAVLDGMSHLIRPAQVSAPIRAAPPLIPGVAPLLAIFKPRDPNALPPVKAIGLVIDYLDHPFLLFPLQNVHMLIEPLRHGLQVKIRDGIWRGTAVEGDIAWISDPTAPTVDAHLTLRPLSTLTSQKGPEKESPEPTPPAHAGRWASGRFEMQFRPQPTLPFQTATGFFRLEGSDLLGHEVEIQLATRGKAAIRTKIGLLDPDSVDLDLSFALTDATLEEMSEFVALPPGLATGKIGATGTLDGRVRPDASFIAELDGSVRLQASDGFIRTDLPLLLRLGKATEGYNPFANEDELSYESMSGTLDITQGKLRMEDFELEGPLRVYANVRIDTNQSPGQIEAVVGVFLFRTANQIFSSLPLIKTFLPGSDRGLIGAYFKVEGPLDEPEVDALALKTLMTSVPDAIKAPFKAMRFLFGADDDDDEP